MPDVSCVAATEWSHSVAGGWRVILLVRERVICDIDLTAENIRSESSTLPECFPFTFTAGSTKNSEVTPMFDIATETVNDSVNLERVFTIHIICLILSFFK